MVKHKTLEQNCEGFAPKSNRQCILTGYYCDKENKKECVHYQFIQYRLNVQKYERLNGVYGHD
jgi:hypothetical protein